MSFQYIPSSKMQYTVNQFHIRLNDASLSGLPAAPGR